MGYNLEFFTDKGIVRSNNEDNGGAFTNQHGEILLLVADGMGGHNAGEVASSVCVKYLKDKFQMKPKIDSIEELKNWIRLNINKVNLEISKLATNVKEYKGMGTTLVMAIITDKFLVVANIGDSRAYILKDSGFEQITDDHTFVNLLLKNGKITEDEAKAHPQKHVIVSALGLKNDMLCDIYTIEAPYIKNLLLCSDGLTNLVLDAEIKDVLSSDELSIEEKSRVLIQMANDKGGQDNISVALAEIINEGSANN